MDVLMNEEHHGIISFLEHGNGFIIHKKRVFAAEVLPKYFKASKASTHSSILESTVSDYSLTRLLFPFFSSRASRGNLIGTLLVGQGLPAA
jgi:HSF-type DNA-binding